MHAQAHTDAHTNRQYIEANCDRLIDKKIAREKADRAAEGMSAIKENTEYRCVCVCVLARACVSVCVCCGVCACVRVTYEPARTRTHTQHTHRNLMECKRHKLAVYTSVKSCVSRVSSLTTRGNSDGFLMKNEHHEEARWNPSSVQQALKWKPGNHRKKL